LKYLLPCGLLKVISKFLRLVVIDSGLRSTTSEFSNADPEGLEWLRFAFQSPFRTFIHLSFTLKRSLREKDDCKD